MNEVAGSMLFTEMLRNVLIEHCFRNHTRLVQSISIYAIKI